MSSNANEWSSRLRAALTDAMRRRDRAAMGILRVAIAALDNATARADVGLSPAESSEHVAGALVGLGAGEAERVELTESEQRALIEHVRDQCVESGSEADLAQAGVLDELLAE